MNRNLLKTLIYINVLILILISSYKIYLFYHESDFQDCNYENMKMIERIGEKSLFSFAVVGSVNNSIDIFQNKIIDEINSNNDIIFAFSTGNAVLDGAEDKYRMLNNSLKRLQVPVLIGIGDNEISDGGDRRFYKHFGPYYYSFAYGDNYFIFIDTTGMTPIESQKDWISNELNNADRYSHKFVFMNDAPIELTKKNLVFNNYYIEDKDFRTFLLDEFSIHEVTGVFTNGSMIYEKKISKDVPYYSSGGAGGLLLKDTSNNFFHYLKVEVSPDGVTVEPIEVPLISRHPITQKMESIWIFIHSIFYVQFVNILLAIFSILFLLLFLHRKASKDVDYYKDFSVINSNIDIKDKLSIAMFTNNYLPFVGGVPISIKRLAYALRKRGHKVVIFAPEYPGTYDYEDDVFRCKLLFYKKTSKFNYAIANIYSPKIDKEFMKSRFDVVHVHHPFWMGGKGLNLGKQYNIPVVLTYHTRLEMYSDNLPIFKLVFKNILSHRIIRNFAQKCDAIISPTISAKEYLENVGVSRQKLILPTGIDFEKYRAVDEISIETIKNQYAPKGEVLLCSVSRLSIEKNINFLIRGLNFVKEHSTIKFKCMIIGDGPERENIQNLIDEHSLNNEVILIGSVNQEEISKYYLASDLFVFSSLSETQGMVLLEAMAGKCPVVCVRSSGTDDVISVY
ncbi:MAG: glycosyltransferase [Peptostreptococcaceae bacterium]|nr:glycosyltransferase [Peptostreptococcaceae bacterium]